MGSHPSSTPPTRAEKSPHTRMKYLLVLVATLFNTLTNAQLGPFGSFGSPFKGFSPVAPALLPPRPVQPPTLQFQVPPGTCGFICSVFDLLAVNPNFSTLITAVKAA